MKICIATWRGPCKFLSHLLTFDIMLTFGVGIMILRELLSSLSPWMMRSLESAAPLI